jgi:hypothetical protein
MPLPQTADGIWKEAESSKAKEENGEVWAQESGMRERESASKILSPLPTLTMLEKASCVVLDAITPCATYITDDK